MKTTCGETTINHQLEFRGNYQLDLQVIGKRRLERVKVEKGDVIEAQVRPYILETEKGPVEVADLHLDDDGIIVGVRMACFRFFEEEGLEG